jgi:hypothetical protein
MSVIPCTIYTRKSSEEGLEQGFNSLDTHREACEAFILSGAVLLELYRQRLGDEIPPGLSSQGWLHDQRGFTLP